MRAFVLLCIISLAWGRCAPTDMRFNDQGELVLAPGQTRVCFSSACPPNLDASVKGYLAPGDALQMGPGTRMVATKRGSCFESTPLVDPNSLPNATTTTLACFEGNRAFVGSAPVPVPSGEPGVYIVGQETTGTLGPWTLTHVSTQLFPDGRGAGKIYFGYLTEQPNVWARIMVTDTGTPLAITATKVLVGNVTRQMINDNSRADALIGDNTVIKDVTVDATQTLCVPAPVNGQTNILTIISWTSGSVCGNDRLRDQVTTRLQISASTKLTQSSILTWIGNTGNCVMFPSACPTSGRDITLRVYSDASCTGSYITTTRELWTCTNNVAVTCTQNT